MRHDRRTEASLHAAGTMRVVYAASITERERCLLYKYLYPATRALREAGATSYDRWLD